MSESKSARQAEKRITELSGATREFARQGAEETNKAAGEAYATFASGAVEFHRRWIEMIRANSNATLNCDVAQAHDLEQAVLHFEPRRRWKTNRGAARSFDACMRLRAPFDTRPSAPSVTGRKRARGERQLRRLSSYEVHLIGFQTTSV